MIDPVSYFFFNVYTSEDNEKVLYRIFTRWHYKLHGDTISCW